LLYTFPVPGLTCTKQDLFNTNTNYIRTSSFWVPFVL